jgi:hypothetical protein
LAAASRACRTDGAPGIVNEDGEAFGRAVDGTGDGAID